MDDVSAVLVSRKKLLRLTGYWIYPSPSTELSSWDQGHSRHPRYHAATGRGTSCGSWAVSLCHRWARQDRPPLRDLRPCSEGLCTALCKYPIRCYWNIQDICVLLRNLKTLNVSIDSRDQDSPMAIDEPCHHLNEVGHWLEYHPSKRSRVQVFRRTRDYDFKGSYTTKTICQRRNSRAQPIVIAL